MPTTGPAYRSAEIQPQCSTCPRTAVATCRRCGRPLCEVHAHGDKERCPLCEASFARLAPLVSSAALALTLVASPLYLVTGWPPVTDPPLQQRLWRRLRRRFLRQQARA